MADETNIMLNSPDTHGNTRIGVNGVQRQVPHNVKTKVTEAELEVLRNADLGTAKLVELGADEEPEAEVTNLNIDGGAKDGTEGSPIQAPATPADTSTDTNPVLDEGKSEDALKGGDVKLKDGEDAPVPASAAQTTNKPAGRTKGAGTTKAKAVEGGK